jgi:hypothetical protein
VGYAAMMPLQSARAIWASRWGLLRLCVALLVLWVIAADTGARLARLQLESLPGFDYGAEVRHLRSAGRYGEALIVADAGLESTGGDEHAALLKEKQLTLDQHASITRRLKDAGMGALTGSAGSDGNASLERLGGAIAADLFVVGDVRDLLIQSGRYVMDGEVDPLIVLLSGIGLATTLAPEIDWVPSLLKIAKKAGKMTHGMEEFLKTAVKGRRVKDVEVVMADVGSIAKKASPAGAIRLMEHADGPKDVAAIARFLERNEKGAAGAFALHVTEKEGADLVKAGAEAGEAGARAADSVVGAAARHGAAGRAWLRTGNSRLLLKPHPLIGLLKGLRKGNVQMAVQRAIESLDGKAWWLVPLLAAWVVVEIGLILRRFWPRFAAVEPRPLPA